MVVVGQDKVVTHGFFPSSSRFDNFPHHYPCKNHAPSQFSCRERNWLGYLIKDAYLHDDKAQYVCRMPQYTFGGNLNPKHIITNQWWGLGLLLCTMIIYNIYIIYI